MLGSSSSEWEQLHCLDILQICSRQSPPFSLFAESERDSHPNTTTGWGFPDQIWIFIFQIIITTGLVWTCLRGLKQFWILEISRLLEHKGILSDSFHLGVITDHHRSSQILNFIIISSIFQIFHLPIFPPWFGLVISPFESTNWTGLSFATPRDRPPRCRTLGSSECETPP